MTQPSNVGELKCDAKIVAYEDGEIRIKEAPRTYIWMNGICVDFDNNIVVGECSCCGKSRVISFHGNVIDIDCIDTEHNKQGFSCKLVGSKCPGKKYCINADVFDAERHKTVMSLLHDLIDKMIDVYGSIFISICSDSRDVITKYYLPDELYVVATMMVPRKTPDSTNSRLLYVLTTNIDVYNSRRSLGIASDDDEKLTDQSTNDITKDDNINRD
jgi:hypothetical protein